MSFDQSAFTLIALPQSIDAAGLVQLHILFIPRNISPLEKVDTPFNVAGAMPFIDARPTFIVKVVNKSTEFPGKDGSIEKPLETAVLEYSANIENIYRTLKDAKKIDGTPKYFDIDEARSSGKPGNEKHIAPEAIKERDTAIRKYLPKTYRESFNFTSPRIKNAVTDDSYHCAMRDQSPVVKQPIDNKVSWGKVYAHLLRQPVLAVAGGLLYKTTLQLDPGDFEKGGWLYVDLKDDSDYHNELMTSVDEINFPNVSPFIKRYAAKIPPLKPGEARPLFTAVAFPVMNPGKTPDGNFDELFIEAGRYNHGFATIVHSEQPHSQNLLKEAHDGLLPQKEIGIRLGWEDEQILIWYLRQMAVEAGKTERIDAPLCVMGYNIDVRIEGDENTWESLNEVSSKGDMVLEGINLGAFAGELAYQVYPTKINSAADSNYWLPMYFANWNNSSIVIPDDNASRIYKNESDKTNAVNNTNPYLPAPNTTNLQYGSSYEFRVRFSDISGGGPGVATPSFELLSESHITKVAFKRYVAPDMVRIMNEADVVQPNTDDHNFTGASLELARPIMGYPGVQYTGKYTDPVQRLIDASQAIIDEQLSDPAHKKGGRAFGIADPDVVSIQVKVEVETLQMDNLASDDGKQNYITLYTTNRNFNPFDEDDADESISIPITFIDEPVLDLTNTVTPFSANEHNACIAATDGEIVLPRARNIRITLRADGGERDAYWGADPKDASRDPRFGKTKLITIREESINEEALFTGISNPQLLQGIYLQPDPVEIRPAAILRKDFNGTEPNKLPDIVQRFAQQLNVEVKDKSLYAPNGERIHFWCSSRLRHNMAPDNSSVTFANKNELERHWLVCTTLTINRDWSWDSLDPLSFEIQRKFRFGADPQSIDEKAYQKIGDVELKKTASYQAIQAGADGTVQRNHTRIIFIDVVDGTPVNNAFPDISEVQYNIITNFRPTHEPDADGPFETEVLLLPVTVKPHQSPKLIGAGIALSPYIRNAKYSASEARRRFLWLEFDKTPEDQNDALFCRMLGYAPDQLLSNNNPSLWQLQEDAPLNLDPEYIRVITPNMGIEHSGLKAMDLMTKSKDADRHFYLLPVPKALHAESPEMFGFFTFEFRYGHTDKIPCTAQARFHTQLRVAGLQYPAPTLMCILNRNEKEVSISAPYAQAVFNGQDVTSNPPRTAIWALLYAQVTQADGSDYRNILLTELELAPNPMIPEQELFRQYIFEKISEIERQKLIDYKDGVAIKPYDLITLIADIAAQFQIEKQRPVRQASGAWNNQTIHQALQLYGLPDDTSLSVVCVEVFGQVTNIKEQINKLEFVETVENVQEPGGVLVPLVTTRRIIKDNRLVNSETNYVELANQLKNEYGVEMPSRGAAMEAFNGIKPRPFTTPLSDNLGKYRIVRTSPLTEIPFVCCTEEIENTLGFLSLRGSLICDFAIPDNTNIDGWLFDKISNTIQCTGDIDNDGIDEIVITNARGMAIVKYMEGSLRLLFTVESNTALGAWVYDDATNASRDWGFKIAPFTGQPQNELLLISNRGLATLKWEEDTLIPTQILQNGQIFANWKVNTSDRLVGVAKLFNATETNIVFENNIDMHLVSMSNPGQTFTARTGIRYGQWLFNRADNKIQSFGDFDGDVLDEIFISSPWGIGILKWVNGVVVSIAMHINGSSLNGYVVDNKHVFGSVGNYLGNKNQEIVVHDKVQLQAVLVLDNGNLRAINTPNKSIVFGDLAGEFIAKLDRDEKSDWIFKNDGTLLVINLDQNTGVEVKNIIAINNDIDGWKIKAKDTFIAAGNFLGRDEEHQMLILAGV
ncbi:MAG: hypothetical protein ABI707_15500 [Ferruginibacter sp.]